jgi:hypothetical protein
MKMPQHIFALSRSEQRVVLIIMLCLVLAAAGKKYYDRQLHPVTPAPPVSTESQTASPADEETSSAQDDSR